MLKRFISGLVVALGLAAAGNAAAQEILITGPLAGAPAIRKERLYRKGRFEIAPSMGFSLLDEYRRSIFLGGRLQYNLTEWLSIGVYGSFALANPTTDLADQIDKQAPRNIFTINQVAHSSATPDANGSYGNASFANQTAKLNWIVTPQIQFTPFRGKLAIFQKVFVDTDAYLHGGVAIVGLQERAECGGNAQVACDAPVTATSAGGFGLTSKTMIAPSFGLGLNFYFTNFLSLGIEYRAFPFSWNRAGFDSRGSGNSGKFPDGKIDSKDDTFSFNQMINISIGISLPAKPTISE